jgi:hypothetical protein
MNGAEKSHLRLPYCSSMLTGRKKRKPEYALLISRCDPERNEVQEFKRQPQSARSFFVPHGKAIAPLDRNKHT